MANNQQCVAIHGVPRSGTSWIGEIFNSSPHTHYRFQPLFSYAHKNFLGETSPENDIEEFFNRLLACQDEFTMQTLKRATGALPTFKKKRLTHIVYKETQSHNILFNMMRRAPWVKLCAVMRNPLSVLNSWFQAPREFRSDLGWSEAEEWRYAPKKNSNKPELFYGYERWKEAGNIFHYLKDEFPGRVYILRYDTLLKDPISETNNLFEFYSLKYSKATNAFLEASSKRSDTDPYSVFRQKQTDEKWRHELLDVIIENIKKDLHETILEEYL